jgi:2-haloacid dehalogenase
MLVARTTRIPPDHRRTKTVEQDYLMSSDISQVKALVYDVFGSVVDWRGSIIREVSAVGKKLGVEGDWEAFADKWRGGYHDGMQSFRDGKRGWMTADTMHRERLDILLAEYGLTGLSEEEINHLNKAWHRLDPWPDAVAGLTRLKSKYIIGTLSNGNVGLLVSMAKYGGIPWDVVMAGELFQSYKPDPKVYLGAAKMLGLEPGEVMMCAAHLHDLHAAAKLGLRTGFVARPNEYGNGARKPDLKADDSIDVAADTYDEFASKMGV